MEYDYQDIAIKAIIGVVIALVLGLILAYFNVGRFSFVYSTLIAGVVIGFLSSGIESALIAGGIAGVVVSILQGIVPHFVLPPEIASLFGFSIIGQLITCLFPSGVVALIKELI